ncbi:hypothetical protein QOM21_37210 [Streptomyces sp. Pv4-95]|uniref:helix-turn-helix domain-containing protein n=1 Tax=Streptomyces sp. Pv4-95 TaxID=3049543 RepID=UPI003891B4BD
MRINLTARTRAFTVLGNEVLRDRRLSFTARGILSYLLSLPDGSREDVRTLADKNPGLGRRGVAKAIDELIALGYYARRTLRDEESGQIRTTTYVFDTPQPPGAPHPAPAGTGDTKAGKPGTSPEGEKNQGEEPTHPRPLTADLPSVGYGTPTGANEAHDPPRSAAAAAMQTASRGAAFLAGLSHSEPRLALSATEALGLAPLADRWLDHGVTEQEARSLLTAGLPPVVHSARAFLTNRLTRKLPPHRARPQGSQAAAPLAECLQCRDPLPRGRQATTCTRCTGTATTPVPDPTPAVTSTQVAALRRALRDTPSAAPAEW